MACIAGRSAGCASRSSTATSTGISRLLAIEDALQGFEMRGGVFRRIGQDEPVRLAEDLGPYRSELAPHRACQHLQAASALEVVERIERLGDRRSDDDDAVVREEHDALGAEH